MNCKVVIDYPCPWVYKVIGDNVAKVRAAIESVAADSECVITESNSSRSGKYICLNAEIIVNTDDERVRIHLALKGHQDILIVM